MKKTIKRIGMAALALTASLSLTACMTNTTRNDTQTAQTIQSTQTTQSTQSDAQTGGAAETTTGTTTLTPAGGSTETAVTPAPQSENTFTFTDGGITAAGGSGYEIDGTALKITDSGVYTVTGSCGAGSITVKKGTTGVTLILSDLTLTCADGAPLQCSKETEVTLYIEGTVTLTDAEDPADETSTDAAVADAFEGAAIKVKSGAALTVTGSGTLNLDAGACKNGIKGASEATITIAGATINVMAAHNGLGCDGEIFITGGTLNIDADNDAIHGETNVTITGGQIGIAADDDAIHAEQVLTIGVKDGASGPNITVIRSKEGLEGGTIYLYSGSGSIRASDDGVNAATDAAVDEVAIYLYGGTWYVNADGDGLDSNGNLYVYGGTTEVYGAANGGNNGFDYDGQAVYGGGTLLVVDTAGMNQTPSSGVSVFFGSGGRMGGFGGYGSQSGSISITAGSTIEIKNAGGETIYSATGAKNANCVMLLSEAVTEGETYTLYVNGSAAATATAAAGSGAGGFGGMGQMPGSMGQTPGGNGQFPGGMGQTPGGDGQFPGGGRRH